jgi:hypothetical protein
MKVGDLVRHIDNDNFNEFGLALVLKVWIGSVSLFWFNDSQESTETTDCLEVVSECR